MVEASLCRCDTSVPVRIDFNLSVPGFPGTVYGEGVDHLLLRASCSLVCRPPGTSFSAVALASASLILASFCSCACVSGGVAAAAVFAVFWAAAMAGRPPMIARVRMAEAEAGHGLLLMGGTSVAHDSHHEDDRSGAADTAAVHRNIVVARARGGGQCG